MSGAKEHTATYLAVPGRRMGQISTTDYPETHLLVHEHIPRMRPNGGFIHD